MADWRLPSRGKIVAAAAVLAAAPAGWALVSQVTAAAPAPVQVQNHAVASFTAVESSTHNNTGNSVCAAFVPSEQGAENKGDLNAKKGSFLQTISLPQGATVRRLTLFANDFDGDDGTHVFLVRKQIKAGLSPQFTGYAVMAATQSQGAVMNTMRAFSDTTIAGATVDNTRFYYYLEVVNCATVEPFDVQVAYTR